MAPVPVVIGALVLALSSTSPAVPAPGPARASAVHQSRPAQSGPPSREWKRVTSAHFEVVGNSSDDGLRDVLQQLESFREAFLEMFPATDLAAPVPTTVVVFKDWGAFEKYQPRDARGKRRENVGGYYLQAPERNFVVVPAAGGGEGVARATVLHEFTHYILHQAYPDVPTWLDEGLAEYYSTLKIEKDRTTIGIPPLYRLDVLRTRPLLPLERMFSMQETIKIFKNPDETSRFYAQAWAFVHYVSHGEKRKGQRALSTYLGALRGGASIDQAFKTTFNCSFDEFLLELRAYFRQFSLPTLIRNTPANATTAPVAAQAMTEIEAGALQAELLLHAGALSSWRVLRGRPAPGPYADRRHSGDVDRERPRLLPGQAARGRVPATGEDGWGEDRGPYLHRFPRRVRRSPPGRHRALHVGERPRRQDVLRVQAGDCRTGPAPVEGRAALVSRSSKAEAASREP